MVVEVPYTTRRCMVCGKSDVVMLTPEELAGVEAGEPIQVALPDRPSDFREMLITGTHPECWNRIFSEED